MHTKDTGTKIAEHKIINNSARETNIKQITRFFGEICLLNQHLYC